MEQEPVVDQDEMVALPEHQKAEYLNGYTFARYMIALKVLVVSLTHGVVLNTVLCFNVEVAPELGFKFWLFEIAQDNASDLRSITKLESYLERARCK